MPAVRLAPNQAAIDSRRQVSLSDIDTYHHPHVIRKMINENLIEDSRTTDTEANGDHGKRRIRGIKPELYYNWERSSDVSPIDKPSMPANGRTGDLRFHRHDHGVQTWVLETALGSYHPNLQWVARDHASRHPTLSSHYLSTQNLDFPTWVTWNTITNYASKSRRQHRQPTPHLTRSSSTASGKKTPSRVKFAKPEGSKASIWHSHSD